MDSICGPMTKAHIVSPSEGTRLNWDSKAYDSPILSVPQGKVVKAINIYPDLSAGVIDYDYSPR